MRNFYAIIIACVFLVTTAFQLSAQQVTWDGGGDGVSWNDANNWNPNAIPVSTDSVTIDADVSVTLSGSNGACADLVIGGTGAGDTLIVATTVNLDIGVGSFTLSGAGDLLDLQGTSSMNVEGDWNNNGGTFNANNSLVVFDGSVDRDILTSTGSLTETFYNLTIDRSSGVLACEIGVNVKVIINNNLTISSGEFVVYDRVVGPDLEVLGDVTISNSSNGLDIRNGGASADPFTEVHFGGDLQINETGQAGFQYNNTGIIVVFDGAGDQTYTSARNAAPNRGEYFPEIRVDKSGGTLNIDDYMAAAGDFRILNGSVSINSTERFLVGEATIFGDSLIVSSGATFSLTSGSTLEMDSLTVIHVLSGGTFESLGSSGSMVTITREPSLVTAAAVFGFDMEGTLAARYTNFSYLRAGGVDLNTGSTLHATDNFDFCVFSNPTSGGRYITFGNVSGSNQLFQVDSAQFVDVVPAGGFNVFASGLTDDTLRFVGASGDYAGESFDNDGNNVVQWVGTSLTLTWTGAFDNEWADPSNWSPGAVPTAADNVIIPTAGVSNEPIIGAASADNRAVNDISIQSGRTLTVNTDDTLDVGGDFTNQGTVTLSGSAQLFVAGDYDNASGTLNANTSTVTFDGTGSQSINTGGTGAGKQFNNVAINKAAGTATLAGAIDINNDLTLTSGTFDVSGSDFGVTVADNWSNAATFTPRGGTVTFDGSGTITTGGSGAGKSFNNVGFAGTHVLAGALNVDGGLTIGSGAALDVSGSSFAITVAGGWDNDGTFTPQNGTVTFDGSVDQFVDFQPNDFWNLTINKTAGTMGDTNAVAPLLDVNGNFTLTSGGFDLTGDMDVEGNVSIGSGGVFDLNDGTVNVAGGWANASGTLNGAAASTLIFDGSAGGPFNINEANTINDITFDGSITYTIASAMDINGHVTINSGTVDGNGQSISAARNWTNNGGTFNANFSTVTFDNNNNGPDTLTSGGSAFYDLIINRNGGGIPSPTSDDFYAADPVDVDNDFTLQNGEFILLEFGVGMNVGGDFTIEGPGDLDADTIAAIVLDAQLAGTYSIDDGDGGDIDFELLTINAVAGAQYNLVNALDFETDIDRDLKILSGKLSLNGQTLTFGRTGLIPTEDSILVTGSGELEINQGAVLKMNAPQANGTGNDIVVGSGGLLKIIGAQGNEAVITREGEGQSTVRKWRLKVESGGSIQANNAIFRHMDSSGVVLESGAILHPTNNFSNTQFDAVGAIDGNYLVIGDLFGTTQVFDIDNIGFLNQPAGTGGANIKRFGGGTDTLLITNAFGVFAGEDFDLELQGENPGAGDSGLVVWRNAAVARIWTGANGIAWDDTLNWAGNVVPDSTESAFIPDLGGGANYPTVTGTQFCNNLNLENNAVVTVTAGDTLWVAGGMVFGTSGNAGDLVLNANSFLFVGGDWDNQYGDFFASSPSTVVFRGSADQAFHAGSQADDKDFDNLTINKTGGTVAQVSAIDIDGVFTLAAGTYDISTSIGFNMDVAGGWVNSGGTFVTGVQTVFFDGASGNINGGTGGGKAFYNIQINNEFGTGSHYTLTGDLDVDNSMIFGGINDTLDAGADFGVLLGNDLDFNGGEFLPRNGTFTFDGVVGQNIASDPGITDTVTFYNVTIVKGGGSVALDNGVPSADNVTYLDIDGDLNIITGTLDLNGDTLDLEGNLTISGTLTPDASGVMFVAGDWDNAGTFNASTSNVTLDGINQSLKGNFSTLNLAGSGIKTATDVLDLSADLVIGPGVEFDGGGLSHTIAGNWTNNGTYTAGGGTITFDAGITSILTSGGSGAGKQFFNLTVSKTSGNDANNDVKLVGDLKVNNDLTVTDGELRAELNNVNVNVGGNWTTASTGDSSFIHGAGVLTFDGTGGGPYSIDNGNNPFSLTTINASGVTYNLAATTTILENLNITAGTLSLNGQLLDFGDDNLDSIIIEGTFDVDAGSILEMFVLDASGAGSDLTVLSGGTVVVVGAPGNNATVTRFSGTSGGDAYSFVVNSGGSIEARNATFEFMDANGIQLLDGSSLNLVNNLSSVTFNNGTAGGTYLNVGDINGANQNIIINSAQFLSDPGGGAFNVTKSSTTDTLTFNLASGGFAGEAFDSDPGDVVIWTNDAITRTWTGNVGTDWTDAGNWDVGVPSAAENALIPSAGVSNFPIIDGTIQANDVTVLSGASITIGSAGDPDTLDLSGSITVNSSATLTMVVGSVLSVEGNYVNAGTIVEATSTIIFDGSGDQTLNSGGQGGAQELFNVTINKPVGTVTLANPVEVNGDLSIVSGALDVSEDDHGIRLAGNWSNSGAFAPRSGQVLFDGDGTIAGGAGSNKAFNNIRIFLTANRVMADDVDIDGRLDLDNTGILDASAGNYTLNVGGVWDNDGTGGGGFVPQQGTVVFDGSASQTLDFLFSVADVDSFYNVVVNNTGGSVALGGTGGTDVDLKVKNDLTITQGTFGLGTNALDVEGDVTIGGTLSTGANTINVAGNWINNGSFTGANTLVLDGTTQSFSGQLNNVTLSNAGTKTAADTLDIAGNLTIDVGTTFDAATYAHFIAGDFDAAGDFLGGTSVFTFDGGGSQSLITGGTGASKFFNDIVINTGGTVTLEPGNDLDVAGNLTVSAGTFSADANTIFLGGNWSNAGTVNWTSDLGELYLDAPSGSRTLNDGTSPFERVTVDATGVTYSITGTTEINGDLTITAGTFSLNGKSLQFGNSVTDSILVYGVLDVDELASLKMFVSSNTGSDLEVFSGGTVQVVGTAGSEARVTRFTGVGANDRYSFTVGSGGTIQARFGVFEYMDASGIVIDDGAILHPINNFSDCQFNNGPSGGRLLAVNNINGANQSIDITDVGFPNNPGGGAFNVTKSASTDTLRFDMAFGVFAGETFDEDAGDNPGIDSGRVVWTNTVVARQWTGDSNRVWSIAGNWLSNQVPSAGEDALIPDVSAGSGNNPIVSGTQAVRNVIVRSNGFLTIAAGDTLDIGGSLTVETNGIWELKSNAVLSVEGDLVNNGDVTQTSSSLIALDGTANQTFNAGGDGAGKALPNVTVNKATGTVILGSDVDIDNAFTLTSGTFDVSTDNNAMTVGGNWTNGGSFVPRLGTVTMDGTASLNSGGTGAGKQFYNLTINGNIAMNPTAKSTESSLDGVNPFSVEGKSILFRGVGSTTLANDLDVNNHLTIEAGALLDVSGSNHSINVGGDWLNDGSFQAQNGTVTVDGSAAQNIDPSATVGAFYNLIFNKSGGTASLTSQTLDVTNDLTLTNGTLSAASFNLDVDGNLTIQATASLTTASNTIRIAGDWDNLGTFFGTSTVRFNGTNQDLNGNFYRLILEGGGTKSATGALDINNNITISSGTTFNAVFSHTVAGNWDNAGTLNATGTTITFDGVGTQTITSGGAGPNKAFNNLTINKPSGTVVLASSNTLELDGNLSIANGALNSNNNNMNVAGSFLNSGSFTAGTGTLLFDGTTGGPFSIDPGGSAFNAVTVNAPGRIYNLTGAADINQDITITAGTFSLNGNTLDFGDANTDAINVSGTFEADTGSTLRMFTTGSGGSDLVVNSGGTVRIVGISGNKATVTRFNGTGAGSRYSFLVNSGGRMQARFALFEYMDVNGIQLADGAILNATNNFSDCEFDNGPSGGTYLNVQDLSGSGQSFAIDNVGFLSDPGGGAFNVTKSATDDSLLFDAAFGVFAGESFDSDPNDVAGVDSGFVVWTNTVAGFVWTGNVSTAWDLAGNWLTGSVPTSADDAFIPDVSGASGRFPVVSGTELIRSVIIQTGARLTIQTTDTLEVAGSLTNSGDLIMNGTAVTRIAGGFTNTNGTLLPNSGSVVFNGTAGQEVRTGGTATGKEFYNFVIDKTGGTATLFNDMAIQNDLEILQGTLNAGSDFDITVGGNWNNGGTFVPANGTVNLTHSAGAVTLTGGNFHNLVLASGSLPIQGGSGFGEKVTTPGFGPVKKGAAAEGFDGGAVELSGAVDLGSALDVDNTLTIEIGSSLDVTASNFPITVGGDWDNDGTFEANKGTVTLDGAGAQSVDAAATLGTFWNLTINKSGGTATLTGNLDVDSAFAVSNGTFSSGTFAVDIEGPTTIAGTWTTGVTTSITAGGDWNNTGTFSGSNTVTLDGADQSVNGAFNTLVLGGSGTKTASSALSVSGNLSINGGVTFNGGAFSHSVGGNWTNSAGAFTAGAGTVTLNGSGTQTVTSGGTGATKAFNNLTVNKAGGSVNLAASNALEVNGNLTITTGTLNANTNNILVGGNFSNTAIFTPSTGTLTFDAAAGGPYSINDGSSSLGSVTINAAASNILYQLTGTTDINGNLNISNGTLDLNGNTLTFGDSNTDSIIVSDTLIVNQGAEVDMYTTGTSGSDVVVRSGGTIRIVGASGDPATVTRFNGTGGSSRYSFKVESGGAIEANFAEFEFMDATGINLQDGAILNTVNNFSNTNFSNGASGGTYLNVGDLSGALQTFPIQAAGFLTNPGGGAFNVTKTSTTDSLAFDFATGVFAGESFDNDPGNVVNWTNVTVVRVWTGNTSNSWSTGTNWAGNLAPAANEDASIPDVSAASGRFPRISGTQTVRSVTIDPGANVRINGGATLDMSGTIVIDGELRLQNNATLRLEGDFVNNGVLNLAGAVSTVQLDGSVGQTITTGGTGVGKPFINLTVAKLGGTASLDGNIDLNGNFTLSAGTFDVTPFNYSMNVGGNWIASATFNARNGTVTFDGTSGQALNSGGIGNPFYDLDIASTGTVTLSVNNLDVNHDLGINSGTLSAAALNINVGGDWRNSAAFSAGTGTVTLDAGAGPDTLDAGGSSFNNLSVNASGVTYNLISPLDVNGDLRITTGTLALGSNTLTFGDANGDSILVAGNLSVGANGTIQMFNQTELNVSSGGTFSAIGTNNLNRASMTRLGGSGNYRVIVESGGTISPRFANFQFTGEAGLPGIDIQAGATINATNKFDDCNFSNGIGTAYLRIGNAQNLTINDVRIDSAAAARATSNVEYTGTGSLVFNDYKGTMSGARFENDDTTGIGYKGSVRWIFDEIQPIASTGTFVFGNDLIVDITTLNGLSLIQVALTDTIQPNISTNFAVNRYYTIDATPKAGNATLNLTQYYVEEDLNGQVEAALDMWRFHPSSFFDGPIAATARDASENFVRVNALSSDTLAAITAADWFLSTASNDVQLPVELAYFEVQSVRGKNQLSWKTESEVDNSHWMIQRQEMELINKTGGDQAEDYVAMTEYEAMAYIQGQGTKTSETQYTWSDLDVEIGKFYRYRLADVNYSGSVYYHEPVIVEVTGPKKFALRQNYPNPFNPTTRIRYELPVSSDVSLKIYNILGQEVTTLINRTQKAGYHELQWNGQNKSGLRVSSGVYVYRIVARGENGRQFVQTRKMMVVK